MRVLILILTFLSLPAFAAKTAKLTQTAPVNLTSAGTAQRVSSSALNCQCLVINALAANTGVIYVGDSSVSATNGFPLQKGDTISICASDRMVPVNAYNYYFDGGTTNDDIKVSCSQFADVKIIPKPL